MALGRIRFFVVHKYLFAIISFLTSTFIGETLSYHLLGGRVSYGAILTGQFGRRKQRAGRLC